MSDGTEGTAVITTEQIYTELRTMSQLLTELKVKFEKVEKLEERVEKLEDSQRAAWQIPVAWTSAAAGALAAIYQSMHPGK